MCGPDGAELPREPYRTQPHLRRAAAGTAGHDTRVERLSVTFDGYEYEGWIAFDPSAPPRPVVLVFPNYAGLKQFDIDQAVFLAEVGYVGVAVDLYKSTSEYPRSMRNPEMNGLLRDHPRLRSMCASWLAAARAHPAAHARRAAAIGYCFGGMCVLEMVRAGHDIDGVVSFHGILQSNPINGLGERGFDTRVIEAPNHHNEATRVLIENGDLDTMVPTDSVAAFRSEFDTAGVSWRMNNHSQTPHGFALPPGVVSTAYVEDADRRSTLAMLSLFAELWPDVPTRRVQANAAGTRLGQAVVPACKL